MKCDEWQGAISAAIDGEAQGVSQRLVEAHLVSCPRCRAFREAAEQSSHESGRHQPRSAPAMAGRVSKLAAVADRASQLYLVRVLLALVAIQILAFSFPALVFGDEQNTSTHAARHLGAFTAAYGVALLVVVARPARARALLPVSAVLAGALVITAIVDLVNGQIPLIGETQHIPEFISVVLVWMMTIRGVRQSVRSGADSSLGFRRLRVVDDERAAG